MFDSLCIALKKLFGGRQADDRHRSAMTCFAAAKRLSDIPSGNHMDRAQAEDHLRQALAIAAPDIYTYSHQATMHMTLLMFFAYSPAVLSVCLQEFTKVKRCVQIIDHKNSNGSTALFFAISKPACMQLLLEAGADPSVINRDGETVLSRCVQDSQVESAAVVLNQCGAGCMYTDPMSRMLNSYRTAQLAIRARKQGVRLLSVLQPQLQKADAKDPILYARRVYAAISEQKGAGPNILRASSRARQMVSLLEAALEEANTLARRPNRPVCTPTFTFPSFEEFKAKQVARATASDSCRTPTETSMSEIDGELSHLQSPGLCVLELE